MKASLGLAATTPMPHPSRRYERLIGILLKQNIIDWSMCRKRAMYRRVSELYRQRIGRCHAMMLTASEYGCSYEAVRKAIYELDKESNQNIMKQPIKIKNETDLTTIDIEGTIGLSEEWQFDNPASRVATYERFRECVSQIADIQNSHIVVNIRSTGGDVNDALLIYEALRSTGAHITTRCYGYTASAATIVAQAASEGCRLIAPSSLYLIHNSLCSTEGNAEELMAEVEMLRQTDTRLAEIYASRSGRSVEQIALLMRENGGRGRWLSPAEAIAEGLADALTTNESTPSKAEQGTMSERATKGIKALMRAIGIDIERQQSPSVEDDVNYIPRQRVQPDEQRLPVATTETTATSSPIELDEGQRATKPTTLIETEDPSPVEPTSSPRSSAYERDARALRSR